jgi:hypothetical protein
MSNRLEHEFPALRWRPTQLRNIDQALLRAAMMRGKKLQAAAIGSALRRAIASCARALATFIRYGAHGIAKRAPERACEASPRLRA